MGNLGWARLPGTFDTWLTGALEVGHLSLYGSFVKGNWSEGSLAGDAGR